MPPKKGRPRQTDLRRAAEARLLEQRRAASPALEDAAKLVHELQVHQIELEMQNEELLAAHQELEKSLQQYSDLYDFAPVGYFALDPEGAIQRVNLTGARLLGVDRSRLLRDRLGHFIAPAERSAFNAALRSAFDSRGDSSCEFALAQGPARAAAPRYVQVTFSTSAEEQGCRAVVVDITQRKGAEEELRAMQRVEAVGNLAAGVAHEFNNLLSVILSNAEFVESALGAKAGALPEFTDLKAAALRAAALTRQLLAFGQGQVLRPQRIDVNKIIREIEPVLRRGLGERTDLAVVLAAETLEVQVDPVQIQQALLALVAHAQGAMPKGGTLTVATLRARSEINIAVTDTSDGMEPAAAARLFEVSFVGGGDRPGARFELPSVYGAIKQCGGTVAVQSERGRGTRFDIFLPAVQGVAAPISPSTAASPMAAQGGETVLVVEDDPRLLRATQRILLSAGYRVLAAVDGLDALRVCAGHEGVIHLALCDVLMPNMDGVELAVALQKVRPQTLVLHMSGYPNRTIGGDGLKTHFIGKPFTADELKQKVVDVLRGVDPVA